VVLTPAQIQAAMDGVDRPMPWTPWWAISTLRPTRHSEIKSVSSAMAEITSEKKSQQPSAPLSRDIVPDPNPEYPPAIPEAPRAERLGGVTVQLDVAVERRRTFWWRLVAKMQISRS